MYMMQGKHKPFYNSHLSGDVISVVNQILEPVWLRTAKGTKGERRLYPGGLPISLFTPLSYLNATKTNIMTLQKGCTHIICSSCSVLAYSAVNILNLKTASAEHVKTSTSSTHHSAKSWELKLHIWQKAWKNSQWYFIMSTVTPYKYGVTHFYCYWQWSVREVFGNGLDSNNLQKFYYL